MDELVTHAGNPFPWNLRMRCSACIPDTASGFTDNLQQVGDGELQVFILVELLTSDPGDLPVHLLGIVIHVAEVQAVVMVRHRSSSPPTRRSPESSG